ncbi:hypothetical protein ACFL4W_03750 [Planctomycetota bacterium]
MTDQPPEYEKKKKRRARLIIGVVSLCVLVGSCIAILDHTFYGRKIAGAIEGVPKLGVLEIRKDDRVQEFGLAYCLFISSETDGLEEAKEFGELSLGFMRQLLKKDEEGYPDAIIRKILPCIDGDGMWKFVIFVLRENTGDTIELNSFLVEEGVAIYDIGMGKPPVGMGDIV